MAERLANAAFAAIHPPPSSAMETHISQALGSLAPFEPQRPTRSATFPARIRVQIHASSELKCRTRLRAFCKDGAVLPPIARPLEMTPLQTPSSTRDAVFGSFRKEGVPLLWGPYNKDPTSWGTILGSPIFGSPPISWFRVQGVRV